MCSVYFPPQTDLVCCANVSSPVLRDGGSDGQPAVQSEDAGVWSVPRSRRVAVSVIYSGRHPPCSLLAFAAVVTARHVTSREVTCLTVEMREG